MPTHYQAIGNGPQAHNAPLERPSGLNRVFNIALDNLSTVLLNIAFIYFAEVTHKQQKAQENQPNAPSQAAQTVKLSVVAGLILIAHIGGSVRRIAVASAAERKADAAASAHNETSRRQFVAARSSVSRPLSRASCLLAVCTIVPLALLTRHLYTDKEAGSSVSLAVAAGMILTIASILHCEAAKEYCDDIYTQIPNTRPRV